MSGRLFDPTSDQPLQARPIVPQMDMRANTAASGAAAQFFGVAADAAFALEERRQAVADAEGLSLARSNYMLRLAEARDQLRGADPEQMGPQFEQAEQRIRAEIEEGLPSRLRGRFRVVATDSHREEARRLATMRGEATSDRAVASLITEMDQLRQAASRSPQDAARFEAAIDQAIAAREESGAITREAGARLRIRALGQLDEDRALALLNANPGQAMRALRDGQFRNLSPEVRERMINSAEGRMAAQAARAEANARARDRQVAVEAASIEGMMGAGFVPQDRLAALQQAARGTVHEARVAQLEQDSREIRRWVALPAARQVERLTELRARLEGGRGTPEEFAQFRRLSQITVAQQTDIAQGRGLDRAQADGLIDPLPPLDLSNPASFNARVEAAQAMTAHYGTPVSPFTTEDLRGLVQRFVQGSTDDALTIVRTVAGITDPVQRAEATRAIERARGDAGRVPAGALARVLEMERTGSLPGQMAARAVLDALRTEVSGAVLQAGQRPELQQALVDAQAAQVQGVRVRAAAVGGAAHAELVARDMTVIRRLAMVRIAAGEDPSRAVRSAQEMWNRGLASLDQTGLAHVYYPASVLSQADAEQGLTRLREELVRPVDPALGADAALAERQRVEAARRGVWINDGGGFALVSVGTEGPVVLRRATPEQVRQAARGERTDRQQRRPGNPSQRAVRPIEGFDDPPALDVPGGDDADFQRQYQQRAPEMR